MALENLKSNFQVKLSSRPTWVEGVLIVGDRLVSTDGESEVDVHGVLHFVQHAKHHVLVGVHEL